MSDSKAKPTPTSWGSMLLPQGLHAALQFDNEPIRQFMIAELIPKIQKGQKVLDAGSGILSEQRLRNELLEAGADLKTMDFRPGEGIDIVADVTNTGLPSDSFPVVLCMQVLEHVQNPTAVCKELARVTAPGGWVALSAPQSAWLHNLPYHYFHFTREGFKLMCEQAGLELIKIEPQGGHFIMLGQTMHFSCRVLENAAKGTIWATLGKPVFWSLRLLLGLVFKTFCLMMDRLVKDETNTQGWNLICRKPL